ncbi:MAG: hypothetical protein KTR19_13410 [Hyphomicrobiales bacterium]|nr:hypothetical protein [Hyphomicrobiales bacterium]
MKSVGCKKYVAAGIALVMAGIGASASSAACESSAQSLIEGLAGDWRGDGTVQPIGGVKERISCRVTYRTTGSQIAQQISCAGTDYKIDAGANVACEGTKVSGTWNEQIANNTGRITGNIRGKNLNLEVKGPNWEGRFNVKFTATNRHTLTITQFDPGAGRHTPIATIALRK